MPVSGRLFPDMLIGLQDEIRRVCRECTAREKEKLCFFFSRCRQCNFEFIRDVELLDLFDRRVLRQGGTAGFHHFLPYLKYHFTDIQTLRASDFT